MENYAYAYIHNACKPHISINAKKKSSTTKKKVDTVDNPKSNALHRITTVTRETNDQGEMTVACQKAIALHFQHACKHLKQKR